MTPYALSYIFVLIAVVVMLKNYKSLNMLWLGFLVAGAFIGIAPFVAFAYLVVAFIKKIKGPRPAKVTYNADGSYTVYKAEAPKSSLTPLQLTIRIIGGLIAGAVICYGLLVIGLIIFVSISCGGNSKCM